MKKLCIFDFDPHKSFVQLRIFKVTLLLFALIALSIGCIIISNSNIGFKWDYEGINKLVSIFKVPLSILALIIPVVALLATNHRSEQTKAQIIASQQQNNFSNYFKHIEEFGKYVSHLNGVEVPDVRNAHKLLFPNAFNGDISIDAQLITEIETIANQLIEHLEHFANGFPDTFEKTLLSIHNLTQKLQSSTKSHVRPTSGGKQVNIEGLLISVPGGSLAGLLGHTVGVAQGITSVLLFDHSFNGIPALEELSTLDLSKVPHHTLLHSEKVPPESFRVLRSHLKVLR